MKTFRKILCFALVLLMVLPSAAMPIFSAGESSTATQSTTPLKDRNLWGEWKPGFLSTTRPGGNKLQNEGNKWKSHFVTSGIIEAKAGDKITFGPIPTNLRGSSYTLLGYDDNGNWTENPNVSSFVVEQKISDYWQICTYEVTKATTTNLRISTTNLLPDIVATKNYVFTLDEYLQYAEEMKIDMSIFPPTDYHGTYENLFAVSNLVGAGYVNAPSFEVISHDGYRQRTFDDVKEGDIFYIMSKPTTSGHFICELYEDNTTSTFTPAGGEIPLYADLGGGYAVFAYRVPKGVTKIDIHPNEKAKYEAGELLVTKNQPFTAFGYKKAMGLTLNDEKDLWTGGQRGYWDYNVIDKVDATGVNSRFFSSNAIEIDLKKGDTVTFGPFREDIRTGSNPYIGVGYDAENNYIGSSQVYTYGSKCNVKEEFTILGNLKFYTFTASKDYAKIRFVTLDGLADYTVLTKNYVFTEYEYLDYMMTKGKDLSFFELPEYTTDPLVNIFPQDDHSKRGHYFYNSDTETSYFRPTNENNTWDYRTYEYTVGDGNADLKVGDVLFVASSNMSGYMFCSVNEDGTVDHFAADLTAFPVGNGFSIYVYRVEEGVEKLAVAVKESSYDEGHILVTKNQPFTAEQYLDYLDVDLEKDQVKADTESPLNGLKGLFIGDSISNGSHDQQTLLDNPNAWKGWAGGIAASTGLISTNASVSGARMSYRASVTDGGWIYKQMADNYDKTFDLVVMQGGVNDCKDERQKLGTYLPVTATEAELETAMQAGTYLGGLQWTIYNAQKNFEGATLFFIANYELVTSPNHKSLGKYLAGAKELCEMYGVHYIDLYSNQEIKETLEFGTYNFIHDRIHPNKAGYDVITPYIQREIEKVMCNESTHEFTINDNSATDHWTVCRYCGAENGRDAHIYDNNCDTTCNLESCGYVRTVEPHDFSKNETTASEHWKVCTFCGLEEAGSRKAHTFDNTCDTTCNGDCGYVREITHDFSIVDKNGEQHWLKCSVCGLPKDGSYVDHYYTNPCDAVCDEEGCGFERIPPHDYTVANKDADYHWVECSICREVNALTKVAHVYDNACDTICNDETCGYEREITHDFSETDHNDVQHWKKCSVCGTVDESTKQNHVYDGEADVECDCGYSKCSSHEFTVVDNDGTHHWLECSICGVRNESSVAEHNYSTNKTDETKHWRICSFCLLVEEGSAENHVYESVCDPTCDCGNTRTIVHDYCVKGSDATHHWEACLLCGAVDETAKEAHTFGEWVVTGDTRTRSCACGYSESEKVPVVTPDDTTDVPGSDTPVDPGDDTTAPDGDDTTADLGDDTTEPDDDDTTADVVTDGDGTDADTDDEDSGCGSVIGGATALVALALILPAAVAVRKKDEE